MSPDLPNHPKLELVGIDALKPNPDNPRAHSKRQISQIAASIERFGFLVPIVVGDNGFIVAGEGRWRAALKLRIEQVPVVRASFLTDADRRAFALAENKLSELGGWNDALLKKELSELFDSGYSLEITGFSTADLDFSVDEPAPEEEQVELPSSTMEAVSRHGDLWTIGEHRLQCGDARETESYERLLDGELAAMVFSDPPYGVPIQGHVSGLGKQQHREFVMMSGEQTPAELTAFLRAMFRQCVRFSLPGSIHFQCIDWRHMREMLDAADGVYSEFKQLVVWNKNNAGMGSFYRSQHELLFVFKSGRGKHTNNFGLGDTGRYRTNVWDYAGANTFRKGREKDLGDHPTVKPTALVADAILDCSNCGDLILDPFSGSGTTLIAAHRTGRRGAAIEIDPLYVDTTLRRLCAASGLVAKLEDGRTFEEVAGDRKAREAIDG